MRKRFYKIQIGEKYLSSTGNETGINCKLEVTNVPLLQTTLVGSPHRVASGNSKIQMAEWIEGKDFEIRIFCLTETIYKEFFALAEECKQKIYNNEDATFLVKGTGAAPDDFEVSAIWHPTSPISYGRFIDEYIYEVVFRFITKGVIED